MDTKAQNAISDLENRIAELEKNIKELYDYLDDLEYNHDARIDENAGELANLMALIDDLEARL